MMQSMNAGNRFSNAMSAATPAGRRSSRLITGTHSHVRSGAVFHMVLIYMSVTSGIMVIAGVCLHSVLKADRTDRQLSQFHQSLLRADRLLREDVAAGAVDIVSPQILNIAPVLMPTEQQFPVQWEVEHSRLTRRVLNSDELVASELFVFPAGSQIEFLRNTSHDESTDADPDSITDVIHVRFTEPSVFVPYAQAGDGGTHRHKAADETAPPLPAGAAIPRSIELSLRGAAR